MRKLRLFGYRPPGGVRWEPLMLDAALTCWRARKQAGRAPLKVNELRTDPQLRHSSQAGRRRFESGRPLFEFTKCGPSDPRCPARFCVPSMGIGQKVQVLWGVDRDDPSETLGVNRERRAERSEVARPVGRRAGIGYEAVQLKVSVQMGAKLLRSRSCVLKNPALVQGQPMFVPGEIS